VYAVRSTEYGLRSAGRVISHAALGIRRCVLISRTVLAAYCVLRTLHSVLINTSASGGRDAVALLASPVSPSCRRRLYYTRQWLIQTRSVSEGGKSFPR